MTSISPLQLNQPKSWSGMTDKNHLMYLMGEQRELFTDMVDDIMAINYSDEYRRFLSQFPVRTLEKDSEYEWYLKGINIRNYPLVNAYADLNATSLSSDPGFGFSTFVLEFDVRMFEHTDLIVGSKPEVYQLQIVNEPVAFGTNWLYEVRLWGADATLTLPLSELAAGTRWTKLYSPAEQKLSEKGGTVQHDGYFKMVNRISKIRKQYEAPGEMIDARINDAKQVKFKDANGKMHMYWIDMLNVDYLKEWDCEKAYQILYSKWNKLPNGVYAHDGTSGNPIKAGSGFYEQISPSNISYNTFWDLDFVLSQLQLLSYNKIKQSDRKFKIMTGEGGFTRMHGFIDQTAVNFSYNNAGSRVSGSNTDLKVSGQFKAYGHLNGIEFELEAMPVQDDPRIPSPMYPGGNLPARSYELLIMQMGTASDGIPNVQQVRLKNNTESHRYIVGMRSPFDTPGQSAVNPTMASSGKDGWEVKSMCDVGIQINNPTKIARILPNII